MDREIYSWMDRKIKRQISTSFKQKRYIRDESIGREIE